MRRAGPIHFYQLPRMLTTSGCGRRRGPLRRSPAAGPLREGGGGGRCPSRGGVGGRCLRNFAGAPRPRCPLLGLLELSLLHVREEVLGHGALEVEERRVEVLAPEGGAWSIPGVLHNLGCANLVRGRLPLRLLALVEHDLANGALRLPVIFVHAPYGLDLRGVDLVVALQNAPPCANLVRGRL